MLEFMKQYFPKLLAFLVAILIFFQVLPPDYDPFEDSPTSISDIDDDSSNPSKWSVEHIVEYYKAAAGATSGQSAQSFEIIELPAIVNVVKGVINSALSQNSISFDGITGGYENLVASDLKSAQAYSLGNYIYISLVPREQVDGIYGKKKEGTVGHVVDVLDGVATAVQAIGLSAEYPDGSVTLDYKNAYAKNIKINTRTGEIVSGEWGYDLYVTVNGAKLAGITFKNVEAAFSYKVNFPA